MSLEKPTSPVLVILESLIQEKDALTLVQIGAHVGDTFNDPFFQFISKYFHKDKVNRSRAILVEPVKYLFDQLVQNYGNCSNIEFENSAIAEESGFADFYYFKELSGEEASGLPWWISQVGTLVPERISVLSSSTDPSVSAAVSNLLLTEHVRCLSIQELIEKYKIGEIDFLLIDAEGYDFKILTTLDFSKTRPRFIQYEHDGFSWDDQMACRNFLISQGYECMIRENDTICWI